MEVLLVQAKNKSVYRNEFSKCDFNVRE